MANRRWIASFLTLPLMGLLLANAIARADSPDDIESVKTAAAAGDARAQYRLGHDYETGTGVPVDMTQAAYWLTKAVRSCSGPAMDELGQLYLTDEHDVEKGARLFRLAAAEEDPAGEYDWGLALLENRAFLSEVENDGAAAPGCRLLDTKHYDAGSTSADGTLLYASEPEALKKMGMFYIRKAASLGDPRAKAMLSKHNGT